MEAVKYKREWLFGCEQKSSNVVLAFSLFHSPLLLPPAAGVGQSHFIPPFQAHSNGIIIIMRVKDEQWKKDYKVPWNSQFHTIPKYLIQADKYATRISNIIIYDGE